MTTDAPRRPWARRLVPVLTLLLVQGLVAAVYVWVERARGRGEADVIRVERLDRPAAALTLMRPDGTTQSFLEMRERPVLLHFWATWCAPCRVELPKLLELGRALSRDGRGTVVAVVVDDDWPTVRRFFGGTIPPEVVALNGEVAKRLYDVSALPDSYLIDAGNRLRLRFHGARDWQDPAVRVLINEHR